MKQLINLDVPDLAAAEAFYSRAFGLRVARRLGTDVVEMLGGTAPVYLLEKPAGTIAAGEATRTYDRHWMPAHLDVQVDVLEPALARALAAGAIQEHGIREADWGRMVQIADPFGHGWCLLQFTGRGYDALTL